MLVGFGTHLEQVLAKQLNSFHAQSDVALHCCCLALVVAVGWSAAGGGFCGSTVHLPEVHMSVGDPFLFPRKLHSNYSPTFRGMRFLVPLLYCLHCSLLLAPRFLAVVLKSLLGWSNNSTVGSKVLVRRRVNLCTGKVLKPSLGIAKNGFPCF